MLPEPAEGGTEQMELDAQRLATLSLKPNFYLKPLLGGRRRLYMPIPKPPAMHEHHPMGHRLEQGEAEQRGNFSVKENGIQRME